jgi:hypothetical protein
MRGTKKIPWRRLSKSSILAFQLNRLDQETTAWHSPENLLRSAFLEKAEGAFRPVFQK